MLRSLAMLGCLVAAVATLTPLLAEPAGAAEDRVVVFAAASLKNALDKVNTACEAEAGGLATISYAATSALAKQIQEGAPADIFFAADVDWMDKLTDGNLIRPATSVKLLGNEIVLIAPSDSSASIEIASGFDLAGLIGDGRLAMANVDAVPAGKYGKASLEKLDVWESVKSRIAQAENVRAALALVALGEAPLGIVYRTDARAEAKVKVIATFPADSHPPIIYPVAQTTASTASGTSAFLTCLTSSTAKEIFEAEGFVFLGTAATN